MGRPATLGGESVRLSVALPVELDERIRAVAKEHGTSYSDVVRRILDRATCDYCGGCGEWVDEDGRLSPCPHCEEPLR